MQNRSGDDTFAQTYISSFQAFDRNAQVTSFEALVFLYKIAEHVVGSPCHARW
jgi:hypothetical protein